MSDGGSSSAKQLRAGRQGFVITPLVEETDHDELTSVLEAYEALCNGELEEFRLQLVHGRMRPEEKQAAMDAFREREAQVLVATSVVEVGIDVPNAAVMTIENAERFGMASLHQLRGRVGRGRFAGYVALCPRMTPKRLCGASAQSSRRPMGSSWPRSILTCGGRANCWGRGSTAFRRCASPTCAAITLS